MVDEATNRNRSKNDSYGEGIWWVQRGTRSLVDWVTKAIREEVLYQTTEFWK